MDIAKEISKQIELEARKNGLLSQIRDTEIAISEKESAVKVVEYDKAKELKARDSADASVAIARQKVKSVEDALEEVKKRLKETLNDEAKVVKERNNFTDDIFATFDNEIELLNSAKAGIEKSKADIKAEIETVSGNLESVKQSLKDAGYILQETEVRKPKTTTI